MFFLIIFFLFTLSTQLFSNDLANFIIESSEARQPGLCVHLIGEKSKLTIELANAGHFIVHGLLNNKNSLSSFRKMIQRKGIYGKKISVEFGNFTKLPYADNLVNLVVIDKWVKLFKEVSLKEILRIICPSGVAFIGDPNGLKFSSLFSEANLKTRLNKAGITKFEIIKENGIWVKIKKPRPRGMDEWTHQRHGAGGNLVSYDTMGVPTGLRWCAGPLWASGTHKHDTSAVLSANGRNFYLTFADYANFTKPPSKRNYYLVARDAYNGLFLWRREWESIFPVNVVKHGGSIQHKDLDEAWEKPGIPLLGVRNLPLVAVGDKVYTGVRNEVVVLDAATGNVLVRSEYLGSFPDTVIFSEGNLIASTVDTIFSICPNTGNILWEYSARAFDLVASQGKLFFLDASKNPYYDLVGLDMRTGEELWRFSCESFWPSSSEKILAKKWHKREYQAAMAKRMRGITLNFCKNGILFIGSINSIYGVSQSGKLLWSKRKIFHVRPSYIVNKGGLFVKNFIWHTGGEIISPITGETMSIPSPTGYPARCQNHIATERFFISTRRVSFCEWGKSQKIDFPAIRGSCRVGVIIANNLLYNQPQDCFCRDVAVGVVNGFTAFESLPNNNPEFESAVEFGPAFGKTTPQIFSVSAETDWVTFLHDIQRSGATSSTIKTYKLKLLWEKKLTKPNQGIFEADKNTGPSLGDPLTGPVVKGNLLVVALPEDHCVLALNALTGKIKWRYITGGRVDSSPTLYRGYCLFGCHDGWVYCLRASDGKLIWRFRAAPYEKRIMAYGHLESPWPVPGNILVMNDIAYFLAGRSSAIDGGIYVYALEIKNANLLWQKKLTRKDYDIREQPTQVGCLPDVLISDGKFIYLTACLSANRVIQFNPQTGDFVRFSSKEIEEKKDEFLFLIGKPLGLIDSSWRAQSAALRPRKQMKKRALYGAESALRMVFNKNVLCQYDVRGSEWGVARYRSARISGRKLINGKLANELGWALAVPPTTQFSSILLTKNKLLAAGSANIYTENPTGILWIILSSTGKRVRKLKLSAPPVSEGMIVANNCLYISLKSGKIICLGN